MGCLAPKPPRDRKTFQSVLELFLGNSCSPRGGMVGGSAKVPDVHVGGGFCLDALWDWLVLGVATWSTTEPGMCPHSA